MNHTKRQIAVLYDKGGLARLQPNHNTIRYDRRYRRFYRLATHAADDRRTRDTVLCLEDAAAQLQVPLDLLWTWTQYADDAHADWQAELNACEQEQELPYFLA